MQNTNTGNIYTALVKAIGYAAGIVILLWLLYKISGVVLLLLFVIVLALIINAPVAALERKKMRRFWACAVVFGSIILIMALLGWLIFPKINEQFRALINNLPSYADQLSRNVASWFSDYPDVSKQIREEGLSLSKWIPSVPSTLIRIGNFSLSILSTALVIIVFISMVVYSVTNPRPLVQLYFSFFPPHYREKAKIALLNTSTMLIGWIRSNIIGGTIESVCITIFLSFLNVPGAWVWGALTFFAQFIPRIGFYIMAIPPILVSLSISGATALWVTIFLLALDEIMGDFVLPKVRSSTMNIHPVSLLFVLLAMGTAFGLIGILMATPLTAIIKAYYEEFYLTQFEEDKHMKDHIDSIVYRNKPI